MMRIEFTKAGEAMSHTKTVGKKKRIKQNICYDVQTFLQEGLGLFVCIYMLLIVAVLPFYYTEGYARIGTDKYEFFYDVSVAAAVVVIPLACIYLGISYYIKYELEKSEDSLFAGFSVTDWFVLGYGAIVLLSYFFSVYRETGVYGDAWKGTGGWYMGACSQLIFVGIYFAVSRFWKARKWLPALWLPVMLAIFVLGLLNRFDIRPLNMPSFTSEFISTIGNINWYCGYIVISLFGVMYYFWTKAEQKLWGRILLAIWLIVGFASLITQGSRSGILALFAGFVGLYLLSMKDSVKLEHFFLCCTCFGVACVCIYLLRARFEEHYNYGDSLWDYFGNHPLAWMTLAISMIVWILIKCLNQKERLPVKLFMGLGYIGGMAVLAGAVVVVILMAMNTQNPGSIGVLSDKPLFTFDASWGSNRGATWMAAWKSFADQGLWNKLVGIGPDAMVMYINSGKNVELLQMVEEVFGHLKLTNAHNEWFTILVNEGLLGLIAYGGIMISAMVRYFKAGATSALAGACGMAVLAYTANNMFSFQQTMATSTMFLVLGMGEACLRKRNISV